MLLSNQGPLMPKRWWDRSCGTDVSCWWHSRPGCWSNSPPGPWRCGSGCKPCWPLTPGGILPPPMGGTRVWDASTRSEAGCGEMGAVFQTRLGKEREQRLSPRKAKRPQTSVSLAGENTKLSWPPLHSSRAGKTMIHNKWPQTPTRHQAREANRDVQRLWDEAERALQWHPWKHRG